MGTVGSLFTGCYGLDLGLELAGWRTVWACENDDACRRVLARRRPDLHVYPDVRDTDALAEAPPVDLLAGGFPCQDLSYAGRGRGLDGDRSALWFDMARAIRMVRPRLVLVENVPGLATRGLGRVMYDLAEAGYVGSAIRLGAADLGAPHRRERIFLLAADAGRGGVQRWADDGGVPRAQAPRVGEGLQRQRGRHVTGDDVEAARQGNRPGGVEGPAAPDAGGERRPRGRGPDARRSQGGWHDGWPDAQGHWAPTADADDPGRGEHGGAEPVGAEHAAAQRGRPDAAADAGGGRRRRGQARQQGDVRVGQAAVGHEGDPDAALGVASQAAADPDSGGRRARPGRGRSQAVGAEPEGGGAAARPDAADASDGCASGEPQGNGRCGPVGVAGARAGRRDGDGSAAARVRGPGGGAGGEQVDAAADAGGEPGQSGGWRRAEGRDHARAGQAQDAADPDGGRRGQLGVQEPAGLEGARGGEPDGCDDDRRLDPAPSWGPYEPAIVRWEAIIGRSAPRPTDDRGRLNPNFVEWMLGYPDGWTDGERRTHRLRMLGNSVQVQCGEYVGQILMEALLAGA